MTTKERLHALVDELSDAEADDALEFIASRRNPLDEPIEPDELSVPAAWRTFEDGTPQPNWTALIRADRDSGH